MREILSRRDLAADAHADCNLTVPTTWPAAGEVDARHDPCGKRTTPGEAKSHMNFVSLGEANSNMNDLVSDLASGLRPLPFPPGVVVVARRREANRARPTDVAVKEVVVAAAA